MKIAHINTERTFRGGEVQTLLLARELQSRGHENVIIAQNGSLLSERAGEVSIRTLLLSMRGELDPVAALRLRKVLLQELPNIIHAHTPHAGSLALLARRKRTPVVVSRRVIFPLKNFLSRLKYQKADAVLAVSQSVRNQLVMDGILDEKIHVAESGTDFSAFEKAPSQPAARVALSIPESAFVIGNVSYFDRHKGQSLLIKAFAQFATVQERPCYLVLVGDGPLLDGCRSLAQHLNLADRVLFTGQRFDVANLYAVMDLFLLSSIPPALEGWSGVLREAMGFGLPVIAVRQPATEEQIRHNETGILVSASQEKWVEAMHRLYSDVPLCRRLAQEGMKEARKFHVQAMADKTEACYRAVATGG